MIATGEQKIEIPYKIKAFILVGLVFSLRFVISGIQHIFFPPANFHPSHTKYILVMVVEWSAILFFGLGSLILIARLIDFKPALIIDKEGLIVNIGGIGRVEWEDITEIAMSKVKWGKAIKVNLKDPEKYINRQSNVFRKKIMKWNYKRSGTVLNIPPNIFNIPSNQLLLSLQENLQAYRESQEA